jgi:integrase
MARKSTGGVVEKSTSQGTVYALRFRALGKRQYVTLGRAGDGWTRTRAEEKLADVRAEIRLGIWRPAEPAPALAAEPRPEPTFHEFASEWFASKKLELRPRSVDAYESQLRCHLLPFFKDYHLSEITRQEIDRYKARKLVEQQAGEGISNETINKTLVRLGQILEVAVEYDLIDKNPAVGRRVKLKTETPARSFLDRADHIEALLDAARSIDRENLHRPAATRRLPIIATLMFAGLRLDEMLSLRDRDVDLIAGVIRIPTAKTDAGVREVEILPALREVLALHLHQLDWPLVFGTANGKKHSPSNIRRRVLASVIERANEQLLERGVAPLPASLTPHSLRRTFASLLFALERPPTDVMEQLGHTDPKLTLRIYARAMKRGPYEKRRLQVLAGIADDLPGLGTAVPLGTDGRDGARIAPNPPETAAIDDSALQALLRTEPRRGADFRTD